MTKNYGRNPRFIGIGPTKTGSTWLEAAFNQIPGVEMPKMKELRFFWGHGNPRARLNELPVSRIERKLGYINVKWRKRQMVNMGRRYRSGHDTISLKNIMWDARYLFHPQTVSWYLSLFPTNAISGDLDPQYFYYDEPIIKTLKQKLPETRVFTVLRDPIDKYWSDMRMWTYYIQNKSLDGRSPSQIARAFRKLINQRPRYSDVISLWRKHYDDDLFRVFFYDDLKSDPHAFLSSVCEFVGIASPPTDLEIYSRKVFVGEQYALPDEARFAAQDILIYDLRRLVALTDSPHPRNWLSRALEHKERLRPQFEFDV